MFKIVIQVVLLVVSVSVVWSLADATYFLGDNIGFEILDSIRLDEYHRPIIHSNLPFHFVGNSHDISIPHLAAERIQYINEPIHHLHRVRESGFNYHNINHEKVKKNNIYPNHEHNSHSHHNHQTNQQKLEIKSPGSDYSVPQGNNKHSYQSFQNDRNLPDSIFKHSFHFANNYHHNIHQIQSHKNNNPNKVAEKTPQSNNYEVNQQKVVDVDFSKSLEPKIEQKTTSEDYEKKEEKNNSPIHNEQEGQKLYLQYETKDQNSKSDHNASNYGFQHNVNTYPAIYHQSPLQPAHYIKLHEGTIGSFSELPSGLGQYRDINLIRYHPGFSSNEGIKIHSHTPILISDNVHPNLDSQTAYLIELKNEEGFPVLEGYTPHQFLENNGSQSDLNTFSKYSNQQSYNSDSKLEQKPVTDHKYNNEQKSDQIDEYASVGENLSEYKGISNIPEYSSENTKNKKTPDVSYHSEQKTLEIGYKSQSDGDTDSYGTVSGNADKYNDEKNENMHKYSDTNSKVLDYSLEQKTLEVKSSSPKVDYASKGNDGKSSESKTEQKSVHVDFMSGSNKYDYKPKENTDSDYTKLDKNEKSKYLESPLKKIEQNLEQKSVETETYKEIKATLKSSDDSKKEIRSSHENYSDYIRSAITNLKKDIGSKILNYEVPSYSVNNGHPNGGSSTSYFNSPHSQNIKNDFNHGKRSDYFPYSNKGNHIQHKLTENNYGSHDTSFPKYPSPVGTAFNYHHPGSSHTSSHSVPARLNYNRPYISNKPSTTRTHSYSHHISPYNGISQSTIRPRNLGVAHRSAVPIYHQAPFSSISTPLHQKSIEAYNEKFVKVSYEHPHHSLKKDEPIYISSTKPNNDYKKSLDNSNTYHPLRTHQSSYPEHPVLKSHSHSPVNSNSYVPLKNENDYKNDNKAFTSSQSKYPDQDIKELKSPGDDYSDGIGNIEYPGIGEKSSSVFPKSESKHYFEPRITEKAMIEQKSYGNDESIPTYKESKGNEKKPSENEDYGIGEIGTISGKSEIVGGRHPIKRPAKGSSVKTKSIPSKGEEGSYDKTEQKYLPITATLSDKKPDSKQYGDSIKTKTPEKTEQQELAYEALLGGSGPPNHATAGYGYGFNAPAPPKSPSYPDTSSEKDHEHSPPMAYEFHFDIKDDEHGSEQYRREKVDDSGYLTGSYGFKDSEGIFREVEYEASKEGFKVNNIKTNEPGTDNEDPADVHFEVQKHH